MTVRDYEHCYAETYERTRIESPANPAGRARKPGGVLWRPRKRPGR